MTFIKMVNLKMWVAIMELIDQILICFFLSHFSLFIGPKESNLYKRKSHFEVSCNFPCYCTTISLFNSPCLGFTSVKILDKYFKTLCSVVRSSVFQCNNCVFSFIVYPILGGQTH